MRKFLFILFIWTSFYFCLTSVTMAQEDRPDPDRPRVEQQMERIRQTRNELNEQRGQLEMERQELEVQRERNQQQMERIRQARNDLNEQQRQIEMERQELEVQRDRMQQQPRPAHSPKQKEGWSEPFCVLVMVMCLVVNILAAVWVFHDIRTRAAGSGIWIVIALIAGLLGVLVYAVVRLGDMKRSE